MYKLNILGIDSSQVNMDQSVKRMNILLYTGKCPHFIHRYMCVRKHVIAFDKLF